METTYFLLDNYIHFVIVLFIMTFRNVLALVSYYPSLQVKTKRDRAKKQKLLTQYDFFRLPWKPHIFCMQIYFWRLLSFSLSNI